MLDGSSKIKEIAKRAKELGMDALAITDHGVMYGVVDFYRAAKKEGVKPILGCEVYVAPGSRYDREVGHSDDRYYHLVLLAENQQGYQNLMKIVSKGFTEGFYYRPRVDYEVLREYSEGVIALSACLAGIVATHLRRGDYEGAKREACTLRDIFGEDDFFLELQDHGIAEQQTVNQGLLRMSGETGIPLVATNDSHYTYEADVQAHDVLLCIQTQKKVDDEDRMRYEGGQYYLKSPEEMKALFPYALQAIENTGRIADRCNVEIVFGEYKLPAYDVPKPYTSAEYLRKLCGEGLRERYEGVAVHDDDGEGRPTWEELRERLEYEIKTIEDMGFVDYFLIVWDFIKFAKDNGVIVGPGRGSAAGSVVSYCLKITDIEPIRYGLLFERFLNPERQTMPDIDIDFCYERRQEVIDYVVEKYGKERVVQIVTFGTMAARAVIRDVGRALDLPYAYVDVIAKMIPTDIGITIEKALKGSDLKKLYQEDEQAKKLIDMAKRLEGLPRHTSMHAAGVVISKEAVDEYVPLSKASDDTITTQFTMTTLEELGLLKMDFLGLRTLTVIQDAERLAGISMDDVGFEDEKVYALIGSGKTEGVFQLESAGMKSFMKELRPESLEDVIAGISLYRPGPMDFIPKYVKGKNSDQDAIRYDCPQLEPILKPTYGCIVYQEQVMQIVRDLAGYSYGRSDLVRRAMSKKKVDVMERERKNFVYGNEEEGVRGCVANGIDEKVAQHIFDEMEDFAKYAFNKSHAAAYAVIAYQTAYLKQYHPVAFMAALLNSVMHSTVKVSEYIMCLRQMGIRLLPPDVNEGYGDFTATSQGIRYGMSAIRGIGKPIIDGIVEERERGGPFTSLKDFIVRLSGTLMNKRAIENLVKAGAMDELEGTRRQKVEVYADIVDEVNRDKKQGFAGQVSLFDLLESEEDKPPEVDFPPVGEYDKEGLLAFEKEMLGVYISGHPLEEYEEIWSKRTTKRTTDFQPDEDGGGVSVEDGKWETIGGMVVERTIKTTRTNATMAFVTVEDLVGTVEVIVFPRDYDKYRNVLVEDAKLFIRGKVSVEEDKPAKLILQEMTLLSDVVKEVWVRFNSKDVFIENEKKIYGILSESDGKDEVVIYLTGENARKKLPPNYGVVADGVLLGRLRDEFGDENVRVREKSIDKSVKKR